MNRTWKNSTATLTLTFPKNLQEQTVMDISRRIRMGLKQELEGDGAEVFGKDAPKVGRTINYIFSDPVAAAPTLRQKNPKLGKAYDLLRSEKIPFYNNKLRSGGRSIKPLMGMSSTLQDKLERLADEVVHTGKGMPRYHFYVREAK